MNIVETMSPRTMSIMDNGNCSIFPLEGSQLLFLENREEI